MSERLSSGAPSAQLVSRECARRIDEFVIWLGLSPADKRQGVFTPLNPTRGDRRPGSFVIYGAGHARAGGWVEYAVPGVGGAKSSLTGDALDLCAYIRTGDPRNRREGYQVALSFLGWEGARALDLPHQEKQRRALERDREIAEKNAADELAENRRHAFDRWANRDERLSYDCVVWRYLKTRGIDLARFAGESRLPGAIRQRNEGRVVAMSSLITSPDGKPWSVHRTFLKPDGSGKAEVNPQRKIWPGGFQGGAIRLAKGINKCSPEEAARDGLAGEVLAIGEGVETMLSVSLAAGHWRSWAAGNVNAIGAVVVPPSVETVVLVGENDESPEAQRAFTNAIRAQASQAREKHYALYVTRPPAGSGDFNDALQSAIRDLGEEIS